MAVPSVVLSGLWAAVVRYDGRRFREAPMARYIPAVPAELLIKANLKSIEDREKYGSPDVMVSIVTALADKHTPEECIAVSYRLTALAYLVSEGHGDQWTLKIEGKEFRLLNLALFRAAAKAPLREPKKMVRDIRFNPKEFLRIALEEAETEGSG